MKNKIIWLLLTVLSICSIQGQEEIPHLEIDIPSQNLLKFNRFLIHPTFSTVREDKSYINLYHRNENGQFDDANDLYFISYSGRIGDRTGFGLSLFQQQYGTFSNFGVLANYGYGIRLAEKSALSFGFNLLYYNSGFDAGEANPAIAIDPRLSELEDGSFLSFQPGINLAIGSFDVGIYAENLLDYNFKTSKTLTEFKNKTYSAHIQYTHPFENATNILEKGRLMLLARGRMQGEENTSLSGSLLLDLPKIGWLQAGYDDYYGAAAGIGFNVTKRLSLGYTIEKGLANGRENLGPTHEISFAYSFEPNLTEDRVMLEEKNKDELAEAQEEFVNANTEIEELKQNIRDNNEIIAELIFRQDSIERAREEDMERRFAQIMHFINTDKANTNNKNAIEAYNINDRSAVANQNKPSGIKNKQQTTTRVVETTATKQQVVTTVKKASKNPAVNNKNTAFVSAKKKYEDAIDREAVANKVRNTRVRNLQGVEGGYYIIANVYKGNYYLNKFVDKLNTEGHAADYFKNPKNGLKYVYLKRFDSWQEALNAYKSNVDGTYNQDIWIMTVDNGQEDNQFAANTNNKNTAAAVVTTKAKADTKNKKQEPAKSKELNPAILQKNVIETNKNTNNTTHVENLTEEQIKQAYSAKTPKKRTTAIKGKVLNITNQSEGYYIIANVFAVPSNATRFVKKLKNQGLDADFFVNPENNYRYVYLRKHDSWNSALVSYYSNLNNSYYDEMWIMRVNTNLML